ncbi:hypothetical protein D3C71_1424260 [compost metagenome]
MLLRQGSVKLQRSQKLVCVVQRSQIQNLIAFRNIDGLPIGGVSQSILDVGLRLER